VQWLLCRHPGRDGGKKTDTYTDFDEKEIEAERERIFRPMRVEKDIGPEVIYAEECWHCGNCRISCPVGCVSYEFPITMLV